MKLSKIMDLNRKAATSEMLSRLEAIQWTEKWLKAHGLAEVMEENANGFSACAGTDYKRMPDETDWDGRPFIEPAYAKAYFADFFVPAEFKVLVQKALMASSTEHGLDWEKRTALSYTKPYNSGDGIPFMYETWECKIDADEAYRIHEVEIHFYWVPEIGEQIGDCTIEVQEEHVNKVNRNVVQVCRKPSDA